MSDGTGNTGAAGTGNTDPNGGQGQGGNGGQGGKIEYTPEQQEHMDGLIKKNHADAMTKAEAKYSGQMSELQGQIQGLKTELEAKGKEAGASKDKDKDLTALKDKIDSMEKALKQSHNQTAMGNIKSIAAELGAVNSDAVATLVTPFVRIEDGKTSVLNADGQTRFSGEGKEMTVGELVKEYLNSNPYLVKASNGSGAGSKGARFDGTKTKVDFSKLEPVDRINAVRAATK
jgi:DNA-binding protein YbaB